MSNVDLSTSEREALARAIVSGYYNHAELAQLMYFGLGERIDDVAAPGTLPARVMAVIEWAEASGRTDELIRAACLRRPGNPMLLAFRERSTIVSRVPEATEPADVTKKQLILFLAANPSSMSRLALDEECAAIDRELRMTAHRGDFEFCSKWAVTVDEMMRHLGELQPTIVHFSGHGADHTGIYLQGDQGEAQLVTARALAMMISSTAAASTRVVVLNACYSDQQANTIRTVVDCVVGMTGAIGDDAARSFAVGFYRALGNRRSVGNAIEQAVATLAAKQMPDEVLPRCVTRDGIDMHRVFLDPS